MLLVSEPTLGEDEKLALSCVIDSNWITTGGGVRAFEEAFARVHDAPDAVAVSSCTAGLHLALLALGVGPGDEVLVPSLSFVATANAVIYAGAKPVFVDIESLDVPLMSLSDAAAKCTSRTKAVIVMHYAGYLVDREAWRAFADRRRLRLVEDSAHAVGSDRGPVFGDLAAFSFFGNKNMTTGEGGMVAGRDESLLSAIRIARSHGMTTTTVQRLNGKGMYDVIGLGFNYRMDELSAALGLVQLGKLGGWNMRRRQLTERYRRAFAASAPDIGIPFPSHAMSTHHILPALLPAGSPRSVIADALRQDGIQTSFHYPPIHLLSFYRGRESHLGLEKTEMFSAREITLPLHPKMQDGDVERVVSSLSRALSSYRH